MKLTSFTALATALEGAEVRYLIAGGLAVNAHGYLRYTKDVDIVVELIPENILLAFAALSSLAYRPLVPITATEFSNADLRAGWIRDKGMNLLQFWSDLHQETPIDMFVSEPFPFDEEYRRSLLKPLHGSIAVRCVSIPTLIAMKAAAGRSQDLDDIAHLKLRDSDV